MHAIDDRLRQFKFGRTCENRTHEAITRSRDYQEYLGALFQRQHCARANCVASPGGIHPTLCCVYRIMTSNNTRDITRPINWK